jgi:two-component system phosphate regulon sensor histidine kinase PhoR
MAPEDRVSLRLAVPLITGAGAAAGASAGYLVTGEWLYSIPGAAAGAWAASLLATEAIATIVTSVERGLYAIGAGRRPDESPRTRFEEMADLTDALRAAAETIVRLDASASQDRNRLLAALNSTVDAVMGVDGASNICFANVAAERMFFRSRDELVGRPFAWVMPNGEVIEALRQSREDGLRKVTMIERPGRRFVQAGSAPIIGGGDWSALVVFHDITEVKRSEAMRRDFVANVSHELRTPLASVRAVLDTLEGGALSDEPAARDFIGRAQTEVERMTQMVAELLELSLIESGDLRLDQVPFDPEGPARDAVERLQPQAARLSIELSFEAQTNLSPVIGDAKRVERAVMNLVHNALKFTPEGGRVFVQVRESRHDIEIVVSDTGTGIDEADVERIFERFYKADSSRRSEGTGLGLALVKHTAEAHGGSVTVESRYGQGATFTIRLPAHRAAGIKTA